MPSCIWSTIFGKYVGVRLVSALKRWKWLLIIDWLYSGKLPPALTPNLFLKWLVLQAQDRMACGKHILRNSKKNCNSHKQCDFSFRRLLSQLWCHCQFASLERSCEGEFRFLLYYTGTSVRLVKHLTGQSPGRICLSIGSCSLHTTLCSSGTHLDKLNFLCSCYKLDKLVNLFHLVATLHKRNCFFATLLNSV